MCCSIAFAVLRLQITAHSLSRLSRTWQSFANNTPVPPLLARKHFAVQADVRRSLSRGHQHNNPDAVVVLGGGLNSQGGIPRWGQRRLDMALQIYGQPGDPALPDISYQQKC